MRAADLLKRVLEEKAKKADGELAVPPYDNMGTPDNHVSGKNMKVVADPKKGLDKKRDEYPTADVGSSRNENKQLRQVDAPVKKVRENKKELTVPERHQLKIARDTLKMSDQGAMIMGGMTKEEARVVIKRLTGKTVKEVVGEQETAEQGAVQQAAVHPIIQNLRLKIDPQTGYIEFHHPTGAGESYKLPWAGAVKKVVTAYIKNPDSAENAVRASSELYSRLAGTPGVEPLKVRTSFRGGRVGGQDTGAPQKRAGGSGKQITVAPGAGEQFELEPKENLGEFAGAQSMGLMSRLSPKQRTAMKLRGMKKAGYKGRFRGEPTKFDTSDRGRVTLDLPQRGRRMRDDIGNDEPKFEIWWNGGHGWEEVDTARDKQELNYLLGEYRMAFGGGEFKVKRHRPEAMESAHKPAAGEMSQAEYKHQSDAVSKSASVRTKQKDEPTNKGDPGTPKKKEKRAAADGRMDANPVNVTAMKVRGQISELEDMLGSKLNLVLESGSKKKLGEDEHLTRNVVDTVLRHIQGHYPHIIEEHGLDAVKEIAYENTAWLTDDWPEDEGFGGSDAYGPVKQTLAHYGIDHDAELQRRRVAREGKVVEQEYDDDYRDHKEAQRQQARDVDYSEGPPDDEENDEENGEEDFDLEGEMEQGLVISDAGMMGGYNLSAEGKHIDEFSEMDDALKAAKAWMNQNNYWPNLFYVNDHGNVSLIDTSGKIYRGWV